jgi:cell division protein FtsW (lipid II flippase)
MTRCIWALEKEETLELLSGILENDAKSWLAIMIEILPQEDVVKVAITLWATWYARWKAIHENVYQSPLSTHNFVDKLVSLKSMLMQLCPRIFPCLRQQQ